MTDMNLIQVMFLIFSLVCTACSMAYRLGKDVQEMRDNQRRSKRNRRSKH